jgi:starch phosphorylase
VGAENFFLFGLTTEQVEEAYRQGYDPMSYYNSNPELKQTLDMIASGFFCPDDATRFQDIVDVLLKHGDHYLLLADYASYVEAQDRVSELYRDKTEWTKRSILNVAGMGKFSSDRTIREYAEKIWHVAPLDTRGKASS